MPAAFCQVSFLDHEEKDGLNSIVVDPSQAGWVLLCGEWGKVWMPFSFFK